MLHPIYRPTSPDIMKRAFSYNCDLDVAAEAKDMETIIWLDANSHYSGRKYTYKVIDFAASNGDFEMVFWLYEKGYMHYYSEDAVIGAARKGSIPLLELFYGISPIYGFNSRAFDAAITSGHLNTVKWFKSCTKTSFTIHGLLYATISGYLDILKYLFKNHRSILTLNSELLLSYAIFCGQKDVITWIKKELL